MFPHIMGLGGVTHFMGVYMQKDVKRPARPCYLSHPAFGFVRRFDTMTQATNFIRHDYLRNNLKRKDIYMDRSILTWLLDNKIVLQSADADFPLNGLEVMGDLKWELSQSADDLLEDINNV